ncbi:hypothetical protein AB1K32_27295 [Metabacillus dongyingensis]|uniref:hypothetical protein n=1 Tax=Metabacillus dongyingensis TaxID=2874282 RepID=UPI003B8D0B9F
MKEILGYFLIAQAILTGIIVYTIQHLSDSITESAIHLVTQGGNQVSWGADFGISKVVLLLLILVIGMGVFLIKKKTNEVVNKG